MHTYLMHAPRVRTTGDETHCRVPLLRRTGLQDIKIGVAKLPLRVAALTHAHLGVHDIPTTQDPLTAARMEP